jgi:hypothetical protein
LKQNKNKIIYDQNLKNHPILQIPMPESPLQTKKKLFFHFYRKLFVLQIVVPELSCAICHTHSMQIAQDNSGTTKCYSTEQQNIINYLKSKTAENRA